MAESNYMQGDKDNAVTVPFTDDEAENDNADVEEDKPAEAGAKGEPTRKQKRNRRLDELLEDRKQTKAELETLRREKADSDARLARLEGYAAASAQRQNDNSVDPYQARLDAIERRRKEAWQAASAELAKGPLSEDRQQYYEGISRDVEEAKAEVLVDRQLARREPMQRQQSARQHWENQYPEVYRHDKAFKYAQARAQMREAEGEAITEHTTREILEEARTRFKLGPKAAPSASERDRFSGLASSGNGSGGSGDKGMVMTKEFKQMAIALNPDIPEADAIKKWVNGPGKKLREKKLA